MTQVIDDQVLIKATECYHRIRDNKIHYQEEIHCPMILTIMMTSGRYSDFCVQANIGEEKFYKWINCNPLFKECYLVGKVYAREAWEKEGLILRGISNPPGVISNEFEHWRMIGWSRFGISKNSRIRLDLNPLDSPNKHYSQLLAQASNGDFTAAEIKQLMEAINVGLNTHQVFELQREIDELKTDLQLMKTNSNAYNTFSNQATQETNKDTVENSLCDTVN